ncbi:helix-turn-helix domain-containing protein [Corynebacterium pacaense]|uniref:helix-turn-helix domain-containing protein n=1 Tax=Corynebacterium pacaense TaxID=1816684 RepID=UPI0009BB4416|nr:helix-turn-helix domain-containing protein [Corynebacterium pacaense]
MPRPTGIVAHMPPGSVVLAPTAVAILARHFRRFPPQEMGAAAVAADIERMYRTIPADRSLRDITNPPGQQLELTTEQAARQLGITASAIRKRITRGYLPARHDGRRWLITRTDLERHNTHG